MNQASNDALQSRVTELELMFTHLQHDLQQMSEVIVQQQNEIAQLNESILELTNQVHSLEEPSEVRDPEQERPPHY